MAYTNTWNENTPAGSAPANTVDDWLRQEKLDMRERINSILGVAIGTAFADPIVASTSSLANLRTEVTALEGGVLGTNPLWTNQTYVISIDVANAAWRSTASTMTTAASTTTAGVDVIQGTHTAGFFTFPIVLPVGVIVTTMTLYANLANNITFASVWASRANGVTARTSITTGSASGAFGAGVQGFILSASNTTIATATSYTYTCSVTPGAGETITVLGLEVTYTSADANKRI